MDKHRERQIVALIAGELNREPATINPTDDFVSDLHADSIDTANILDSIKITFGVDISMEEAEKIKTVRDIVEVIEEKKEDD